MFLNERCPLVAKVRTKTAELLILRKMEAIEIYSIYPNIWKRINKKSLFNMEQIYHKIKKLVIELSNRYNINIDNYLKKRKSKNIKKKNLTLNNNNENKNSEINSQVQEKGKEEEKEQPQAIIEFKSNMNNLSGNLAKNLDAPSCMNNENMTFLKKNTTLKDTIISIAKSSNLLKKNSYFKNSLLPNSNKLNLSLRRNKTNKSKNSNATKNFKKSSNKKLKKNKTISQQYNNNIFNLSKSLVKYNTIKSLQSDKNINPETENIFYSKKNSSDFPNFTLSNVSKMILEANSCSNISSNLKTNFLRKAISRNERILYNAFTSLTTAHEKSFQLNSSYDNLNKISNNKYIKDANLQSKIKQVLIDECSGKRTILKKNSFLKLPSIQQNLPLISTPKSIHKSSKNFKAILTEVEYDKIDKVSQLPSQRSNNKKTINENSMISNFSKSENSEGYGTDSVKKKKEQIDSSGKIFNFTKFESSRDVSDIRKIKSPIIEPRKSKKKLSKKKPVKINQQLNIISKNIETTSKNINNPGEFYIDFFKNIIAKESRSINGEIEEDNNNKKTNILKLYSGGIKHRDSRLSGKSNIEQSLLDSVSSIKGSKTKDFSNTNLNKLKSKQKSGFNSKI